MLQGVGDSQSYFTLFAGDATITVIADTLWEPVRETYDKRFTFYAILAGEYFWSATKSSYDYRIYRGLLRVI